jgi:hypothetical protein
VEVEVAGQRRLSRQAREADDVAEVSGAGGIEGRRAGYQ